MATGGLVWERTPRRAGPGRLVAAFLILACLTGGLLALPEDAPPAIPVLPGITSVEAELPSATAPQLHLAASDGSLMSRNPDVRALLVSVDGRTTIERYYRGAAADDAVEVGGITKAVVSLLVGIALGEGALPGLDATLGEVLPARMVAGAAPGVDEITVEHLLTMTAALPGGASPATFLGSPHWVAAILAGGTFTSPGGAFSDSDASSHLLSAVVAEATGRSSAAYAAEALFAPLGIDPVPGWDMDPQGYNVGFGGLRLRPRDLLALGQLLLRQGRWAGRQLVPASYVRAATRPSAVPGASPRYGYQLVIGSQDRHVALSAWDRAGHLLEVVPALGLVVVVTSRSGGSGTAVSRDSLRSFIRRELVPELVPTERPQPPVPSSSSS